MEIKDVLEALDQKIDVIKNDTGVVDVGLDGFAPKEEAGALITGVMGGKGKLTVSDFNDATTGGAWLAEVGKDYANRPYTDQGAGVLMVVKIYGQNPHTENYGVHQIFAPLGKSYKSFAWRTWLIDHWTNWIYPSGYDLFRGEAGMGVDVPLIDDPHNFDYIEITWHPYGQPARTDRFAGTQDVYRALNTSMPYPDGVSAGSESVYFQGLLGRLSSDHKKINFMYNNLLLTGPTFKLSTNPEQDPVVIRIAGYNV